MADDSGLFRGSLGKETMKEPIIWAVLSLVKGVCSKEPLENLLCPSPGLLKSLAVTGESESYVDPI